MTLSRADVGRRVVVRRVLPGERGPTGGPAYSDVIGVLEEWHDDHLVVRRRDDSLERVEVSHIVAGKTVPPPPPPRRAR